ncbi:MAG: metalloregulator ArsR/SmtB family transcription factor [Saprospiraceae bacterium]|nr:metalloregulator ArsR/SmtB family transcription factor [Saprospiraceae bacterium]
MAKHKIDIEKFEKVAGKLSSLAHPMRIAIIGLLDDNPMNVTSIYQNLQISQALTSIHLQILRENGFLSKRADGKSTVYSLKKNALLKILECADCLQ